jgi:hypothetical protein
MGILWFIKENTNPEKEFFVGPQGAASNWKAGGWLPRQAWLQIGRSGDKKSVLQYVKRLWPCSADLVPGILDWLSRPSPVFEVSCDLFKAPFETTSHKSCSPETASVEIL